MPNPFAKHRVIRRRVPQVQCVNEKIAALVAVTPWGTIYASFAMAAHLATEAIEAAEELKAMPRVDVRRFQPTLDFWYRVRDYNHAAALAVAGGNETLAEALVTYRFLRTAADEGDDANHPRA